MRPQLAVLLLVVSAARVLGAPSEEHWLQLRSEHFIVLTDSNEKDARRIAAQFERMRSVFRTLIPTASSDEGAPITVLALKDQKDFRSLEPAAYLANGQLELDGLFQTTPDENYILLRVDTGASQEHPYATVYHEYTHFLNRNAERLPLWLNEGLAEFYQNTDIGDKGVLLGQPSDDDILYLRGNRLIPITTLLTIDHTSPYYHEEQKGSVFYAESWALTHYLIVNDRLHGTQCLKDYVENLANEEDSVTAAQHAFGDLDKLDTALSAYVQQADFTLFKIPIAFPVDPSTFKVAPISTPAVNAVRANILANDDRQAEALPLLAATLRKEPRNVLAHETMGFINYREGNIPVARKWYEQAVQLDSHSYLAQYYAAVFALRAGDGNDNAIESGLRASIKLNPSFAPSYDALASFYATRNKNLDEAHVLNMKAIELEPADINYRIDSATVLMEQNRPEDAIDVLKAAEHVTTDPAQLAILEQRIQQLQQYEGSLETPEARFANTSASTNETAGVSSKPEVRETFTTEHGRLVIENGGTNANFPPDGSTGPRRTVSGIVHDVKCYYPSVLSLVVQPVDQDPNAQSGAPLKLYMNDYSKVGFYTMNFKPAADLKPCTEIEGMKARIDYAQVTDKSAAGQILKVELSR